MAGLKSTLLITLLLLLLLLQFSVIRGQEESEKGNLHGKGLILVKVWCLIIMFAGGVSPYFYRWNESILLLGTQFAGGVFLGTALMHFLSDSTSAFAELSAKEYPFSFMLAILSLCWHLVSSSGKETREGGRGGSPSPGFCQDCFCW